MEVSLFKKIIARIVEPKLSPLGYRLDQDPPIDEGDVWFTKTLEEGACVVIDFQPRGVEIRNIFAFAINLTRNSHLCEAYGLASDHSYYLFERLAPALWIKNRHEPGWASDHWWHFRNVAELENVCGEALSQLLEYGIPYVEDLESPSLILEEMRRSRGSSS